MYREKWVRRREKGTGLKNERAMTKERVRGMERKKRKREDREGGGEEVVVAKKGKGGKGTKRKVCAGL